MDRITRVRIQNVRAIESLDLELGRPMTVLIGENGSGKSTFVECLELLHKASEPTFLRQFFAIHGGMPSLLRKGAASLALGLRLENEESAEEALEYRFALRIEGSGAVVESESLLRHGTDCPPGGSAVLLREESLARVFDSKTCALEQFPASAVERDRLLLAALGSQPQHPSFRRMVQALRRIETHVGFDTLATWAARSHQHPGSLRGSTTLFPADRLQLLGVNLASAWQELATRGSAPWEQTLAMVRLGLGDRVDTVVVTADPGGGNVYLSVRFSDLAGAISAANLSDGQLSWLAFVAIAQLNAGQSLLAIDEPELHLHPSLLGRVVSMLAALPGAAPVVLSTHSDRVIELIDDPAEAVRVCSLQGSRVLVSRIDRTELPRWLEQFGDLGQLRAAGYLSRVLLPAEHLAAEGDKRGA